MKGRSLFLFWPRPLWHWTQAASWIPPGGAETVARLVIWDSLRHFFWYLLLIWRFATCFLLLRQKHWNGCVALYTIAHGWMACLRGISLEKWSMIVEIKGKKKKKSLHRRKKIKHLSTTDRTMMVAHIVYVPASHTACQPQKSNVFSGCIRLMALQRAAEAAGFDARTIWETHSRHRLKDGTKISQK